jgi:hypothetical protein
VNVPGQLAAWIGARQLDRHPCRGRGDFRRRRPSARSRRWATDRGPFGATAAGSRPRPTVTF